MSLKAQSKRRLQKLANFLNQLPEEQFNFENVITKCNGTSCGTVACAMGWLPAISSKFAWKGKTTLDLYVKTGNVKTGYTWKPWYITDSYGWQNIADYFGIHWKDTRKLFQPGIHREWSDEVLFGNASAKEVAASILGFIAYKENAAPQKVLVA